MENLTRRDVLALGVTLGASGLTSRREAEGAQPATARGLLATPPIDTVRIGFVGIGLQGSSHVENFLKIPGCRLTAVCDIREERTTWARQAIAAAGHPEPRAYTRGPRDFERLCATEDLDLSSPRHPGNGTCRSCSPR